MRKIGTWLGVLAIALHALWPLIANARPTSVNLVPICTVEGITHYLEVPGGKSPLDDSAAKHQDHCAFCFMGVGGLVPSHADIALPLPAAAQPISPSVEGSHSRTLVLVHGARAPPFLLSLIGNQPHRGNHETAFAAWRHLGGAGITDPGVRVLRLGVLHR